jgi:hypothetical protein
MPRIDVRGRIVDVASPLLGVDRLPREFTTNDPAKLKDELGRLVDAIRALGAEYAAPQLRPLPVAYTDTDLALGFAARVLPGSATVAATLPVTSALYEGNALAVVKLGADGIVRVTARSSDNLIQGAATFDLVEPGLYAFVTDGEHWYPQPDYATRIADVEDLLTIGSPRLLGRYDVGTGLVQPVTIDDTLEMTVGGALQRAALTGDVTAAAGGNATTLALTADQLYAKLGFGMCIATLDYTASTTARTVPFSGADVIDTDGFHDPSSNNTRFTAPTNGIYEVSAAIWSNTSTTTVFGRLRADGSTNLDRAEGVGTTFAAPAVTLWWAGSLNAGQYVELEEDWGAAPTGRARFMIKRWRILP